MAGVLLAVGGVGALAMEASPQSPFHGYVFGANAQIREAIKADAPELEPVYEARRYRPIWTSAGAPRPEAYELLQLISQASADGLNPERYGASQLKAELLAAKAGDSKALALFEARASQSFVDYVADLHGAGDRNMVYTDPAAAPKDPTSLEWLTGAASAPSLHAYLVASTRMNPVYEQLRQVLVQYRASKGGADDRTAKLILLNLNRARALPANPGPRFVIVDAASARMWMYENGRAVDSMKVVVGKQDEPTPVLGGMIRYALFNPYWNVPEDLVRDEWAPRVVSAGPEYIRQHHMQALSDWSPQAKVLDPSVVDWRAVADGRQALRLRQEPGPANMMGKVKFMLPNELGIYLHDTPNRALFAQDNRWHSAGCVRLEDAQRLARWLFGNVPAPAGADFRVDLPTPVPVYITYFTVVPSPNGPNLLPDVYGRDAQSLASAGTAAQS